MLTDMSMPPVYDPLLAMPERLAAARPDVDLEMAREVFVEAATLLHNGLVLDGLDEHDQRAVVAALCEDLAASDPGAAIRARAQAAREDPGLHEPEVVAGTYLLVVQRFQL